MTNCEITLQMLLGCWQSCMWGEPIDHKFQISEGAHNLRL